MTEQYLNLCQDFKQFIETKPFIFENQSKTLISFDNYIAHFFKERGVMDFFVYAAHSYYHADSLDQFKGKFVYSSFLINQDGSRNLYSLVQVSPLTHLSISYPYENRQFWCNYVIYTKNPQDYLTFLKENEKLEYKQNKHVGFVA